MEQDLASDVGGLPPSPGENAALVGQVEGGLDDGNPRVTDELRRALRHAGLAGARKTQELHREPGIRPFHAATAP